MRTLHPIRGARLICAVFAAAAVVAVAACGNGAARESGATSTLPAVPPDTSAGASAPAFEVVATGLEVPWDLAFAPDGRIFVTERSGRIRVVEDGRLLAQPWAEVQVAQVGEAGLTALALPPDFAETRHLYVLGTFRVGGELENRVTRFTERAGRGTDPRVIISGMPAGRFHAGSALEFGPDGFLYVTVGDATEPGLAQDRGSLAGKLLRYRADGTPAPGGPIYALGLRNSQGIDWHPSGALFASEHGPSGLPAERLRRGNDELNHLVPGGNYGWPEVAGRGGEGRFQQPLTVWDPAIAPSGLAVYTGSAFPGWNGNIFVAALRGRHLRRVALEQRGEAWRVTGEQALFENELGRIRAVKMGPDGSLYFTTSNRDGRGDPAETDDRILRLVPR
ncbi:MAG: PQQ-dependent sugar dehydrogenase [Gemmatimonadota bacterium]|nr:PQQ-dependent sugar dehydrogenase [Gemmatimonadota bacterium]